MLSSAQLRNTLCTINKFREYVRQDCSVLLHKLLHLITLVKDIYRYFEGASFPGGNFN